MTLSSDITDDGAAESILAIGSRATALAADEALRCLDAFDPSYMDPDASAECVDACRDAFTILAAASEVLAGPERPARAAVTRRIVEAGLLAAVECAAQCERWADEVPAAKSCAECCHQCADVLRAVLRELADESAAQMSGAT
ncbi:MAG: hypothetical protein QOE09_1507 [Ilumatobacteraceae bacterium]